jgi:1,4-alpha-glucan branching enzyme
VIGDFTGWQVDESYQMNRYDNGVDSTLWWLTISGLSAGVHTFQYLLDTGLRVADPYARQILVEGDDDSIPAAIYPDLTPYPDGLTHGHVATFDLGETPYVWQHGDNWIRPPRTELVIYELLMRDFVEPHDFRTLTDSLDYLQELGVNAIELMPVSEFGGNSGWGYNTEYHFALDKYYGPPATFKAMVDSAHGRGMAVIIDMVFNHVTGGSPLVQLYWEPDSGHASYRSPWINAEDNFENPEPGNWGSDFNHESIHTQYYVDRVTRFWLTEYQVDGFRFDFTKGMSNTFHGSNDWWGSIYDAARIAILKRMADEVWAVDSSAYVILEHLSDNVEEQELAGYGMLLWGNMNYNFNEATMGYHEDGKSDLSWGYYGSRGWNDPHLVTYMESHDEERIMFKNLAYGNAGAGYTVRNSNSALARVQAIIAFFFTIPGPKMIWQFGELGYDQSIDDPCRLCEKPAGWQHLDDNNRRRLRDTWDALLRLRSEYEVFRSAATIVSQSVRASMKRIKLSHATMDAVIVGNFDVATGSISPEFHHPGTWYDFFGGDSINVTDVSVPIEITPGDFHIFTDRRIFTPDSGLVISRDHDSGILPNRIVLHPAYPNPFNSLTRISFDLPRPDQVSLVIFNLRGAAVTHLDQRRWPTGHHILQWNGRSDSGRQLASGIYLARLTTSTTSRAIKLVLLK